MVSFLYQSNSALLQLGKGLFMTKTNLKTLAYTAIRHKIITCEYAPGTFLNEERLTEELRLSRTPVRDALSRLEQEELIEIRPKRGIMVTPLSVNDINMIFEMRTLYEPYILLHYGALLPEKRLIELNDIFLHTKPDSEYFQNNDYFYELDSEFHLMVVNACPNTYIRHSYNLIWAQNQRFRNLTGNVSTSRLTATFQEHLDITGPCLRKNWKEAADKMAYHLEQSKKSSFDYVLNSPDPPHIQL